MDQLNKWHILHLRLIDHKNLIYYVKSSLDGQGYSMLPRPWGYSVQVTQQEVPNWAPQRDS
jgi:hypothetical protein